MNLGLYIRVIKKHLKNPSISDEDLVNVIIDNEVAAASITKRGSGDSYSLDKTRASRIINNKADIPSSLRKAIQYLGIQDDIIDNFKYFFEDYIDKYQERILVDELASHLCNDKSLTSEEKNYLLSFKESTPTFLGKVYISAINENNIITDDDNYIFRKGNNYLRVLVDDIFRYGFSTKYKQHRIIVIPVNTSFDTHLSTKLENEQYPVVSRETLHGEWILRLKKRQNDIDSIRTRINQNLKLNGINFDDNNKVPIGSIAVIEEKEVIFYLLAISDFDEHYHATSSKDDIINSISSLFDYYDRKGQGYTLYVPLVGTGLSRANLSYQESYDLIKDNALKTVKTKQGKINIVIFPENAKYIDL